MKRILLALALFLLPISAEAASCFWVGGTATWDNTNTGGGGTGGIKWASATGGSSACAGGGTGGSPGASDSATFDASSGGGTVTVAATINGTNTLTTITSSAFTGTLDFSVNNPSITISSWLDNTGGTHTVKLGSGTFTVTGANNNPWNFNSSTVTLNAGTSTILFPGNVANNTRTFVGASGQTYATVTVAASTIGSNEFQINGIVTITTLNFSAPNLINCLTGFTVTNALNITGTAFNNVVAIISTNGSNNVTLTNGGSMSWVAIGNIHFSGSPTATNSFNLTGNTGITITGPSGGSSGQIIGG